MLLIDGWRMLSDDVEGADQPALPAASRALSALEQVTAWTPRPCTGMTALAPACHCAGAPSSEQEIPATPDGPAVAVAVRYWTPAVVGASCGPDRAIEGIELSTESVVVSEAGTPAASRPEIVSGIAPCP